MKAQSTLTLVHPNQATTLKTSLFNKLASKKLLAIFATAGLSLTGLASEAVNAQTTQVSFYGNNRSATQIGGEYVVFQTRNQVAQGLVYVQNSDVFSCFKGTYNVSSKQIEQVTYAYPEMGSGRWEFTQSPQPLTIRDFPYQLNPGQISSGVNQIFQECLSLF